MLQICPQMVKVSLSNSSFNREEQKLHLHNVVSHKNSTEWEQLFAVCPAIASLKLSAMWIGSSAEAIGAAYGPTMRELTLTAPTDVSPLHSLLAHCTNLIQFSLSGDGV